MKTKDQLRKEIEQLKEQNKDLQSTLSWKTTYVQKLERDSKFWGKAKIEIFRDSKICNTVNISEAMHNENNVQDVLRVAKSLYWIDEANAEKEIRYKITIEDWHNI